MRPSYTPSNVFSIFQVPWKSNEAARNNKQISFMNWLSEHVEETMDLRYCDCALGRYTILPVVFIDAFFANNVDVYQIWP